MKKERWRGVLALAILSLPALAETGVSFSHKDWEVVCDNTLTCRAAGYSAEEGSGGSVLLTRQAGAGTAVSGELMLAEVTDGDVLPGKLTAGRRCEARRCEARKRELAAVGETGPGDR